MAKMGEVMKMQKMVLYISSKAMRQTVDHSIKEAELLTLDCNNQIGNNISLSDYMKNKGFLLSKNDVDYMIIDLSALSDSEETIGESIQGFLITHEHVRIIIISPINQAGDKILSELFAVGVRDFAVSSDFVVIKQKLEECLTDQGMSYKEASEYKDVKKRTLEEKREVKEVNKVMIGVIGSQPRVGCTHNSIVIANQLKRWGYSVAYVEMNENGALQQIRQAEKLSMVDSYFSSRNIDYYPDADNSLLKKILKDQVYNFIILDFGSFQDCDINAYNRCHVKIVIGNTQPWEITFLADFWNRYDDEAREHINFYLNFVEKESDRKVLKKLFHKDLKFLGYSTDPFSEKDFPGMSELLEEYLPEKSKKKGFFKFGKRKRVEN